ncbi:MAG: preprotein translocase subunit YajC [Alicyclobacillaceae bacterium]|nr:preprotein translocase subunit YajC [Alicyclobacillaceae bacterium]
MWQNYSGILSIIVMFAIFYFLLIRPQQKRQKERQAMLSQLKKGDRVVTIGGIHGTIVDLDDDKVTLRVAETTKIVFERSAISSVIKEG